MLTNSVALRIVLQVLLSAITCGVGVIVCAAASNTAIMVTGRFIVGMGIGLGSSTAPLYVAETAPAGIRGKAVSGYTLFINTGILLSSIVTAGFSYAGAVGWRLSLGIVAVPALVQVAGFFFIPESPRWLVGKGRTQEATEAMRVLRVDPGSASREVEAIRLSCLEEAKEKAQMGLGAVFRIPTVRRALIVGCLLQFAQQMTGISVVLGYAGTIMQMSGVRSVKEILWLTVGVFFALLVLQSFCVLLVDRLGRRPSVLISLGLSAASLLLLGIGFQIVGQNTPRITGTLGNDSSSCSSAAFCSDCIASTSCGFCYESNSNGTLGSCLAYASSATGSSISGGCNSTLLAANPALIWANNFCPSPYSWLVLLGLVVYIFVYSPGMGAMPWTINTEIFPQWARSIGNASSIAVNWGTNLLTTATFLSLTQGITTPGAYYLYTAVTVLATIFFYFVLPETRGKSLEEVDKLFAKPWFGKDRPTPILINEEEQEKHAKNRRASNKYGATNRSFKEDK